MDGQDLRLAVGKITMKTLYAATWQFSGGKCDATDQVYNWKISGAFPSQDWKIRRWRDTPIAIVGLDLVKLGGTETIWWMVGNALGEGADPLLWLGPQEAHGAVWFPTDTGIIVPGDSDGYIDLHGSCEKAQGAWPWKAHDPGVGFLLTIYYT